MKVLVLGASLSPLRASYRVIRLLVEDDHEVIAVGRGKGTIESVAIHAEIPDVADIDIITLYINPKIQTLYYDQILSLKPKRVIFNPGTENPEFADRLLKSGIKPEESCNLVLLRTGQF